MSNTRLARHALLCVIASLSAAGECLALAGTPYKVRTVSARETLTFGGTTTVAGAPAELALRLVITWKAGPARSSGASLLNRSPAAGERTLCVNNDCPPYGPLVGTATLTGSVTPTGAAPISCAGSKGLQAIFGKGSSALGAQIGIFARGSKRLVNVTPSQYSFILQSVAPDQACRVFLDEPGLAEKLFSPFPVSKIGAPTITIAVRKTIPLSLAAGQPTGITTALRFEVNATLAKS